MAAIRLNKYLNQSYHEEESIYNIIPPEPVEITKPRRYHSRYPSSIDPTGSTFGHKSTTKPYDFKYQQSKMEQQQKFIFVSNLAGEFYSPDYGHQRRNRCISFGSPQIKQSVSPSHYLKKGEGTSIGTILKLPQINYSANKNEVSFQSALNQSYIENQKCKSRNPSVPKRNESPLRITPQKKTPPKTKSPLNYLKKKNFGRIPSYLTRIKDQTQHEQEILKGLIENEEALQNSQVYEMPQEELLNLRQGLKDKWNELNLEYQKTSHKVKLDGISQIQKRLGLEQQLAQIEKDIELLNKRRIIVDTTK